VLTLSALVLQLMMGPDMTCVDTVGTGSYGTSLWYFVPTLDFQKISPLQVDCVVNKTHRRQFQVGELNE